jgi:hypothetical protein
MTNDKPGSLARAHALAQVHNSEVAARIAEETAGRVRRIQPKRIDPPSRVQVSLKPRPDSFLLAIAHRVARG